MKYLIPLILIGILLAGTTQAIRFDWSLGQPTEVWSNQTSTVTTSDSIWWVLGQPVPVASTTIQGAAPPVTPSVRNRIMIISENNLKLNYV